MRLNEQDINTFKALSKSELGKNLVDYLRRLEADICDSRTWGPEDTKESSNRLANIIEEKVCGKIMLQNTSKSSKPEGFD